MTHPGEERQQRKAVRNARQVRRARYVDVPAAAVEELMKACGFTLTSTRGERVYERRHDTRPEYCVKVYSTVPHHADTARACGADAIRICAVLDGWDTVNQRPLSRGIFKATRTFRTGSVNGVLHRMRERMREAYAAINRDIQRQAQSNQQKGRP